MQIQAIIKLAAHVSIRLKMCFGHPEKSGIIGVDHYMDAAVATCPFASGCV